MSKCQGQLAGWLASLTLEDEDRSDLNLPRVVCEYVDVFFQISYLDYLHKVYWTRGLSNRALHDGALRFYLRRRRARPFDCALTIGSEQGYDQESVPITED